MLAGMAGDKLVRRYRAQKDTILHSSISFRPARAAGGTLANGGQSRFGNADARRKKCFSCKVAEGGSSEEQYGVETAKEKVRIWI